MPVTLFRFFVIEGGPITWFVQIPLCMVTVALIVHYLIVIRRRTLVPGGPGPLARGGQQAEAASAPCSAAERRRHDAGPGGHRPLWRACPPVATPPGRRSTRPSRSGRCDSCAASSTSTSSATSAR